MKNQRTMYQPKYTWDAYTFPGFSPEISWETRFETQWVELFIQRYTSISENTLIIKTIKMIEAIKENE